ncbi:ankyrin-1-like [Leptopilina heterotoma]|uniref:ankyrin-1-like n=1 Tax=Leptopilina heterotoma TaxID=63436 RepID=UPI001CA9341A|nr:ankyrin-1-like [Leptopilina heterotoma]XP_043469267.1 ankyrin-1-like [Leptopilina heterotoma]
MDPYKDAYVGVNKNSLHHAVKTNNKKLLKLLLEKGVEVDGQDKNGKTSLHLAVEKGYLDIIEEILKYNPDINNEINSSCLLISVYGDKEEHKKIVQVLFEYGFRVGPRNVNNSKLLHTAVEKGYLNIVEDQLKHGANVNMLRHSECKEDFSPLHTAAKHKQEEIAKLLISYKANVNAHDYKGNTPIFYAIENADVKFIMLLLSNGANVKDYSILLSIAVQKECIEIIKTLLQFGVNINATYQHGLTALHFTALRKNNSNCSFDDSSKDYDSNFDSISGEIAKFLLSKGANVNSETKNGVTVLHAASHYGLAKVVEAILEYNGNVNSRLKNGITPLHLSAQRGNVEICEMLLLKGADINAKHDDLKSALHIASEEGHKEICKILLEYGAEIDSTMRGDITPLHISVKKGNEEIIKILLNKGADINAMQDDLKTPLHIASGEANTEIIKILLEHGADIDSTMRGGITPLHVSVLRSNREITRILLNKGADVNAKQVNSRTALHIATEVGNEEILKLLLEYGANINSKMMGNVTALHISVQKRNEEITRILVSKGADVNAKQVDLRTALHIASGQGQTEIVKILAEGGAKIDSIMKADIKPFHLLVQRGNVEMAKILLSKGVDVNTAQEDLCSLLHISAREGHKEIVKILLECGAKVNSVMNGGITPLHLAAERDHPEIIEFLLQFGADINFRDDKGRTALIIAVQQRRLTSVETLLKYGSDINITCMNNLTPLDYGIRLSPMGHTRYSFYIAEYATSITNVLKLHIIKRKMANLYVSEKNLKSFSAWNKKYLQYNCENEITRMMRKKISNPNVTFYDILTRDVSSLAKYMRNENIVQVLKSEDYKREFPMYADMIRCNVIKGVERIELLKECNEILPLLKNFSKLPELCVEEIFSYLSNKDVKIFKVACQLFESL